MLWNVILGWNSLCFYQHSAYTVYLYGDGEELFIRGLVEQTERSSQILLTVMDDISLSYHRVQVLVVTQENVTILEKVTTDYYQVTSIIAKCNMSVMFG